MSAVDRILTLDESASVKEVKSNSPLFLDELQMLLDTSLMLEDPFNNEHALEPWTSTWPTKGLWTRANRLCQWTLGSQGRALLKTSCYGREIAKMKTQNGWNFLMCDEENYKKGVGRKLGGWWCDTCKKAVEYPVLRYKLELGIFDETSHVVVVMFGETASELVKCSVDSLAQSYDDYLDDTSGLPAALENIIGTTHTLELKSHTYYEYGTFESYTYWNLISPEVVMESAGSNSIDVVRDTPGLQLEDLDADSLPVQSGRKKNQRVLQSEKTVGSTELKNQDEQPTPLQVFQLHTKPWDQQPTNALTAVQTCAFTDKETHEGVDPSIVQKLIEMLNQSNSVAKAFRMARNWCHSHGLINVQLKLLDERTKARQYNKLMVAEVAALIINDFGDGVPTRDIIVDNKDSGPK
nr:nucleic acid-binding, OB-fold protein [Tanacetum cinerariifolium]